MKAWIYKAPYEMNLEEIDNPALSSETDVIVKIRAIGLCGSDIHGFSGKTGRRYPGMVIGHEISGEIFEIGSAVTNLSIGQKVTVQPIIYCGKCRVCCEGKTSICLNKKMVGVNMDTVGGLSEYISIPARNVFPISDKVSFAVATFAEPFAVGAGAVRSANVLDGETIAIVGSGVIGLTILLILREYHPKKIFVVDNNTEKLKIAEKLGATPINFAECDPVKTIQNQTCGLGADTVFEAVGLSGSVKTAMYATRVGGKAVWVGNSQQIIDLDMQDVVVKAKSIQGVYCYSENDFNKAVRFIENNINVVKQFVECEIPFEDTLKLMTELANEKITILRGVVNIGI